MDNEIKFRKKWIEWVFDFVDIDVKSLSQKKLEKLQEEATYFSSVFFRGLPEETFQTLLKSPVLVDPEKIQEVLKPLINWAIFNLHGPAYDFKGDYDLTDFIPVLCIEKSNNIERFSINYKPKEELIGRIEEFWTIYNFVELLNGFPTKCIIRCLECGKYFINIREEEKKFCSLTCYNRNYYIKRMAKIKANPKKYRAYKMQKTEYQTKRNKLIRSGQWKSKRLLLIS